MCRRFIMIDRDEVMAIAREIARDLQGREGELASLDPLEAYRPFLSQPADPAGGAAREAFPSSTVALIAPTGCGAQLAVADMTWGFEVPWKRGPVFNTRIETALDDPSCMWAESLARRRCIVPARAFFESHGSETVPSPRTGKPVKRQYAFERPDGAPLLLAGIHDQGRFSLVTTEPNAAVAPVHDRMPLALDAAESADWLAGDLAGLVDRSALALARSK
ncbi:SOS response-associated peptidase [Arabiibacter massiliensis]|uniref:SOS response-associated peptidase n=1 Tax=Arabiibacter massiliensis TaxID=1870985 RepID=UPI0009B99366|nr:SOS response-associated peptidase family protein [Arabiibacter massiliensis]